MSLDLYEHDRENLDSWARDNAAPDIPPSFAQSFFAAVGEARAATNSTAQVQNRYSAVQRALDSYEDLTGEALANPEAAPAGQNRAMLYQEIRGKFDKFRAENPETRLVFPGDEQLDRAAITTAREARTVRAGIENLPHTFGSRAGSVLGDIWGTATDPVNIAAMAIAGPEAGGVLRFALTEGAAGALSQSAIEAGTYKFQRQVNPDYSVGTSLANIGMAGAGGAVIGGGLRAVGKAAEAIFRRRVPTAVEKDALNVAERDDDINRSSPMPGASGEALHRDALTKAAADLDANRPVEVGDITGQAPPGPPPPERVFTSAGRPVDVRYRAVEADSLIASNTPDGAVNPAYPPDLQPRDRTRAASAAQINDIAANLEPARLGRSPDAATGAPIIGPDGVVESGNGRTSAILRAYDAGGDRAAAYRQMVEAADPAARDMRRPVLVAERVSETDRRAFAQEANQATAARMSPTELARADARFLDDATLSRLDGADVTTAGNRAFVRAVLDKMPASERGALMDAAGALNAEGKRRIENALLAKAYDAPDVVARVVENADSDIKAIGGALLDSAGEWAKMRADAAAGRLAPGMDITRSLVGAVRTVMQARSAGRNVAELAAQTDLFGAELDQTGRILLQTLFRDAELSKPAGRAKVAAALRSYAQEAMKNTSAARLVDEPLTAGQIARNALPPELRTAVDDARPAETVLAEQQAQEAVIQEANRVLLAEPDFSVPEMEIGEDGAAVLRWRSADDVAADTAADIAEARELAACAFGIAAE